MIAQSLLIIVTLIIAVIGWFKSERPGRMISFVVTLLLIATAFLQWYIIDTDRSEAQRIEKSNDSLMAQNIQLLERNSNLLAQIGKYQKNLEKNQKDVDTIKEYSSVSKLNPKGLPFHVLPPLKYTTDLSTIMETAVIFEGDKIEFKYDTTAIDAYKKAIQINSKFPFAYFALTQYYLAQGDPKWKEYALKAINIFENTTKIDGHDPTHDQALDKLQNFLLSYK